MRSKPRPDSVLGTRGRYPAQAQPREDGVLMHSSTCPLGAVVGPFWTGHLRGTKGQAVTAREQCRVCCLVCGALVLGRRGVWECTRPREGVRGASITQASRDERACPGRSTGSEHGFVIRVTRKVLESPCPSTPGSSIVALTENAEGSSPTRTLPPCLRHGFVPLVSR